MNKKVALIWPFHINKKNPLPPLWALSLGTYIKEKRPDIKIYILDEQIIPTQTILRKINELKPDIVGISVSYNYYKKALMFARQAKLLGAKVVFGGSYASVFKKEILENRGRYSNDYCVDAVIYGDGEKALFEYISGKLLDKINNLVYQVKTGIIENPEESLKLDSLSVPNRELVDVEQYFKRQEVINGRHCRYLNIYSQKGCRWREKTGGCIFCNSFENRLRLRNPKVVAQEIIDLISKYNLNAVRIEGEDFLADEQWLKTFVKFYQPYLRKLNIYISYLPFLSISARADRISLKIVRRLKKINVKSIFIGFESGDQRCLAAAKKGISLDILKRAANVLNKYQISITGGFIIGLPGENLVTAQNTLKFINKICQLDYIYQIQIQMFTPLPGCKAWEMFIKKTGRLYMGNDLLDWNNIRKDWIKYFCRLSMMDIAEIKREFEQITKEQKRVRFSLIDEVKF